MLMKWMVQLMAIGFTSMLVAGCQLGESSHQMRFDDATKLIAQGQFSQAKSVLTELKRQSLPDQLNVVIDFELERMRRIELDFNQNFDDVKAYLERYAKGVTEQQISAWDANGELEYKVIDGTKRYFKSAGYNLFQLNDDALALRDGYVRFVDRGPLYKLHPHHSDVITKTLANQTVQGPGKRITIRYAITVNADEVPAGEIIRAWLPFPREIANRQTDIKLIGSSHAEPVIAPNASMQRTVYLEATAVAGQKTEFWIEYEYNSYAQYHNIIESQITPIAVTPELEPYLSERAPHIVFTDELKALNASLIGDETNPYRIAKRIFEYVDQIKWGTAQEYSTIPNLSMNAFTAPYADCGQQSLLLITLLRMNGIPARWQSGWEFSPAEFDTMHDWAMVYFAPYGWVPVDVTHGLLDSVEPREKWFYLGGIDSYRLIFNDDYSQPFSPAKQHFRSETVDSQRGEVEWRGGNLYFNQWRYNMTWHAKDIEPFTINELDSQQLVLVTTADANANVGQLSRFEKVDGHWQVVGESFDVVIGRTGLAWGIGLHPLQDGKQKREGDGKAPAGIFKLSGAFGYVSSIESAMPYQAMNEGDYCIDVVQSPLYNQTVNTKDVGQAAVEGSSEGMRRDIHYGDQLYKKGLFVDHNPAFLAGNGSCIFVHLWRGPTKPTAGCTAMEEGNIDALLAWLQPDKSPILVSLIESDHQRLKGPWQLPSR